MKSVIEILEELEFISGRLAKEDVLDANVQNILLKRVFVAAQDPYIDYGVRKFKKPSPVNGISDDSCVELFLVLLDKLAKRELTGNAAKETVELGFSTMTARQQKWCERILLRNLRCGVQESTLNKTWPGLVKSFACTLANALKTEFVPGEGIKILSDVRYPVRVEPKLDGLRCVAAKKHGEVTLFTRTGIVIETLPRIKDALERGKYDNVVLDGEALVKNEWAASASVIMSRKHKKDDVDVTYNVFDAVSIDDWISQNNDVPYVERSAMAADVLKSLEPGSPVEQVPHVVVENEDELKSYFSKCLDDKFEGVMLKRMDAPYAFKRSDNLLKLKPTVTFEATVIGWYEGRHGTKHENRFGGFDAVLTNGVVTKVGSGFNDAFRASIQLEGPDSWIGKIIEIEAQPDPMTLDGLTVDGKARFPVFVRERDPSDVDPNVVFVGEKYLNDRAQPT